MWIWLEGEDYDVQVGAAGPDHRRTASGRSCLGAGWGSATDHYAEYRFHLPLRYFQASLHLRYARDKQGDAALQVILDGNPVGRPVALPSTGGSGYREQEWNVVSIPLGDIAAGEHILRLQAAAEGSEIAIDGFFIADPAFYLPPDFMRFLQEQERRQEIVNTYMQTQIRFHRVPLQTRRYVLPSYAQADSVISQIPPLKGVETDIVSFGYDGRRKPNEHAETVWHALRQQTREITDHAGKLGLYNPTTGMNYLIGFQVGARVASYEKPEFAFPGETRLHLPNVLIEEAQIHEGITATVCFLPCGPHSLLAAVIARNHTDDRKEMYLYQMIAKEPVPGKPVTPGMRTGRLRWIGYDHANQVTISCYDEWRREDTTRPIGQVLCTLGGAQEVGAGGLISGQQSVGHVFAHDFEGAVGRLYPIRYQGTKYRLSLPARSGQVALVAMHLERYASTLVPGPGDGKIYLKRSDDEAMLTSVQTLIEVLELPWMDEIGEQVRRYQEAQAAKQKK